MNSNWIIIRLNKLEFKILLDAINETYGYDFSQYAEASFKRRIENFVKNHNIKSVAHLAAELIHDKKLFGELLCFISVTTSEMFRDPSVFKYLRNKIIPYLSTFPHIRIWHAACATGEEVLSLAIVLKEEGVYDKCSIYATDFNEEALNSAKKAIYPIKAVKEYCGSYQKSGGKATLSDYYHAKYDHVIFDKSLLKNVTFSNHNLVSDSAFIESQLILCRNVMIYFNRELQNKVLTLFDKSLELGGVLCIGSKESIQFSSIEGKYNILDKNYKVYRKDNYVH